MAASQSRTASSSLSMTLSGTATEYVVHGAAGCNGAEALIWLGT
jgi:hypothetical protein